MRSGFEVWVCDLGMRSEWSLGKVLTVGLCLLLCAQQQFWILSAILSSLLSSCSSESEKGSNGMKD